MTKHGEVEVRVVLFQENNNVWTVQCLEYDIAAQGKSIQEALKRLEQAMVGQIILDVREGLIPFQDIEMAPGHYFDMFNEAHRLVEQKTFRAPREMFHQAFQASAVDMRVAA